MALHHFFNTKKFFPWLSILATALLPATALCQQAPQAHHVHFTCGYIEEVKKPFLVHVEILPPATTPVEIHMATGNITYDKNTFVLAPGQKEVLTATVVHTDSGLDWVHAVTKEFGEDEQSYTVVNTGYLGHLKLSSTEPLPYERSTTLTLEIVDSGGKPVRMHAVQKLQLESSDAQFPAAPRATTILLPLDARAFLSSPFQIRPKSPAGGVIHVNATLKFGDDVLTQESLVLAAQPSWLLLFGLAIVGALLHALYKTTARMPHFTWRRAFGIGVTSFVAGCLAYLVANYDVLGLKLDPHVLRTYPLMGFLFSYFGLEVLLADRFSILKPTKSSTHDAAAA